MHNSFLPIGSVVLLKNSTKRLMVVALCQEDDNGNAWQYAGCPFPEGIKDSKSFYLFNDEQISKVFFAGYCDDDQIYFLNRIEAGWKKYYEKK